MKKANAFLKQASRQTKSPGPKGKAPVTARPPATRKTPPEDYEIVNMAPRAMEPKQDFLRPFRTLPNPSGALAQGGRGTPSGRQWVPTIMSAPFAALGNQQFPRASDAPPGQQIPGRRSFGWNPRPEQQMPPPWERVPPYGAPEEREAIGPGGGGGKGLMSQIPLQQPPPPAIPPVQPQGAVPTQQELLRLMQSKRITMQQYFDLGRYYGYIKSPAPPPIQQPQQAGGLPTATPFLPTTTPSPEWYDFTAAPQTSTPTSTPFLPPSTPTPAPTNTQAPTQVPVRTQIPTQIPVVREQTPTGVPTLLPPNFEALTPTQQQQAYNYALEARQRALTLVLPEYQQYFASVPFTITKPGPYAAESTPLPPVSGQYWSAQNFPGVGPAISLYNSEDAQLQAIALHELLHHWEAIQQVPEDFYVLAARTPMLAVWPRSEQYAYGGMFPSRTPQELQQFYPMLNFGAQP